MQVAVLGTGIIGSGMVRNLLWGSHRVTIWNRTVAKTQPLVELGAVLASTPRAAAAEAELVLAVVGDDTASQAVWLGEEGALAGANPGTLLVDSSTLSLDWVRRLAQEASARGLPFLDAPLTGSKDAAQAGELFLTLFGCTACSYTDNTLMHVTLSSARGAAKGLVSSGASRATFLDADTPLAAYQRPFTPATPPFRVTGR